MESQIAYNKVKNIKFENSYRSSDKERYYSFNLVNFDDSLAKKNLNSYGYPFSKNIKLEKKE